MLSTTWMPNELITISVPRLYSPKRDVQFTFTLSTIDRQEITTKKQPYALFVDFARKQIFLRRQLGRVRTRSKCYLAVVLKSDLAKQPPIKAFCQAIRRMRVTRLRRKLVTYKVILHDQPEALYRPYKVTVHCIVQQSAVIGHNDRAHY